MNLEHATLLFLVCVFVVAEIYRARRGLRGVITSADECSIGPVPLPVMTVRVRLEGGDEVTARLNCCTACLGRLNIGDVVRVSDSRDGYVVDLPWVRGTRCGKMGATCD
ncbi:MAG: hypothetical protein RDU20_02240 [Desulfomonilaceae bacterium]|nr:hypothetical protein [Desulfomonilaceae bacterium]